MQVYCAGPLFTLAERLQNLRLADALKEKVPECSFVLPQIRAEKFLDKQFKPDLKAIVNDCFEQVRQCDLILACLDGPDADSGTCVEVGYGLGLGKPVLGYRTDFRASEAAGLNAMLTYGCTEY